MHFACKETSKVQEQIYEVASPVGSPSAQGKRLAPRLDTLEGKTIGIIWNGSFRGEVSFPIIADMLRQRFPTVTVIPYTELPLLTVSSLQPSKKAESLEAVRAALVQRRCDAVITGNGF